MTDDLPILTGFFVIRVKVSVFVDFKTGFLLNLSENNNKLKKKKFWRFRSPEVTLKCKLKLRT